MSEGQALKDQGQQLALQPEKIDDWKEQFRTAATRLAREGTGFTSEDVLDIVGLPNGTIKANANNAVGAMMTALARRGVICKTTERRPSRRPSSHAAELVVWKGNDERVASAPNDLLPDDDAHCHACGSGVVVLCTSKRGLDAPYWYSCRCGHRGFLDVNRQHVDLEFTEFPA